MNKINSNVQLGVCIQNKFNKLGESIISEISSSFIWHLMKTLDGTIEYQLVDQLGMQLSINLYVDNFKGD